MPPAPRLALLLLASLALAGCVTDAPAAHAPAEDAPHAEADAHPAEAAPALPEHIFETNLTFANETGMHEERFSLDGEHWICVDTLVEGDGRANLTLAVPDHARPWQLARSDGNRTSAEMIPGMPGEYVVRIDLADYTGRVWIRVETQP